jgi:glycosyltransferase involved in cell wall biosynthesis
MAAGSQKIKILYLVIDGKVSGGNNVCVSILRAAKDRGYEVALLSPNEGPLTTALEKEGIKVHLVSLTRSFYFHQALRLAWLLKKGGIGLVHTHTCLNSEILARIACFMAGVPIICHQHDPTDVFNANRLISGYQHWLDKMTSRSVFKFIAVARSRYEAMIKFRGYREDKIRLMYNGISIEDFSHDHMREAVRGELGLTENDIAVGLIGRLEPAKGQDTLISAAPGVIEMFPETKFFIIGDDHLEGKPSLMKCLKMIKGSSLENKCFLLGFRPDINRLIHGIDIVVLPSLWEAHSIVILEALAAKKPVIALEVGGTPEIITHEKEGILIPLAGARHAVPLRLAREICRLIGDPDLVTEITENGYKKVKEKFSEEQMIEKVFALYEEVEGMPQDPSLCSG